MLLPLRENGTFAQDVLGASAAMEASTNAMSSVCSVHVSISACKHCKGTLDASPSKPRSSARRQRIQLRAGATQTGTMRVVGCIMHPYVCILLDAAAVERWGCRPGTQAGTVRLQSQAV